MGGIVSGQEVVETPQNGRQQHRNPLFEKAVNLQSIRDISELSTGSDLMSPGTRELLKNSIGGFFFMGTEMSSRMDLVLGAMQYETFGRGAVLMREGNAGDRLFVVEEGRLEVSIKNKFIRTLASGNIVGELALLYNAPRSATVKCLTACKLWSLKRELFKYVQALSSSASALQRQTWLMSVPELASIDPMILSKLASSLISVTYRTGDVIIKQGNGINSCLLLEKGQIEIAKDGESLTLASLSHVAGLCSPQVSARRCSVVDMGVEQLTSFLKGVDQEKKESPTAGIAKQNSKAMMTSKSSNMSVGKEEDDGMQTPEIAMKPFTPTSYAASEFSSKVICGNGTFLGVGILNALSDKESSWKATGDDESSRLFTSPVTVVALEECTLSYFDVATYLRYTEATSPNGRAFGRSNTTTYDVGHCDLNQLRFINVLGNGSFGTVVQVIAVEEPDKGKKMALKVLPKSNIIKTGQINQVTNEKLMLQSVSSPFIMRLFSTCHDADRVYFLTELVTGGDLWSIMYEDKIAPSGTGLNRRHVEFYASNILEALSVIHARGIAYRDLKPENIMIDSSGYLKLIDFGFAKKIPYVSTDSNGHSKINPKSFTLCGTPEYLAPEFIFNSGHDHAVDLWALGVIIYEMISGKTPFISTDINDMTTLFTNIATIKKKGIPFKVNFDEKAECVEARDLVSHLLVQEPQNRLGYPPADTSSIRNHAYFSRVDFNALQAQSLTAPYFPSDSTSSIAPSPSIAAKQGLNHGILPGAVRFNGDQKLFAAF